MPIVGEPLSHFDVRWDAGPTRGWDNSERELTRKILLENGVPPHAIHTIGHAVASSLDEAVALRAWAATNHLHNIIIVTDMFHTRRARWLHQKHLAKLNIHVQTAPVPHPRYRPDNWWQTNQGRKDFRQEWVKGTLYWIKH